MTKFFLQTFGCQTNVLDGEVVSGMLQGQGLLPVGDPLEADVVLLNGCTVRDTADQKVYSQLGHLAVEKAHRPDLVVGVLGCLAQAEGEGLKKRFPVVDLVFGPDAYQDLPQAVLKARRSGEGKVYTDRIDGFLPYGQALRGDRVRAFVEVIRGCSKFCTFCIVPATRGLERSRPLEDVVDEVRGLGKKGFQEVTLLGQNVDSYRDPKTGQDLGDLLRALDADGSVPWLRFVTSHPRHFSQRLIEAVADCPRVCEYVHLPAQSGSDRILEAMNRQTTHEGYLDLARRIRKRIPGVALSTDLIVGFPGETEEDFQRTLDLVEEAQFDSAFSFRYAPRRDTPAADMQGQIPESVKRQRLARLNARLQELGGQSARRKVGHVYEALVEESLDDGSVRARLRSNQPVFMSQGKAQMGTFQKVRITGAKRWSLLGEIA